MRKVTPELTKELLEHFVDPNKVGSSDAFPVKTFRELVEKTAQLAFKNKDNLIFYRGQAYDYRNKANNSTFYPSIYRGDYLPLRELTNRFDILEGSSEALVKLFEEKKIEGHKELKRRKSVQWSILQHYEVCQTPYLDFTHSLRVACSFATIENANEFAYIFVFGLPYLTNRISVNSEHELINIRLLSICPPTAFRPYFQEGYLAGTEDVTTNYDSKNELDFNNRLIAKFRIPNNKTFWGKDFDSIPKSSLYPDGDPIFDLCQEIKQIADKELRTGDIGQFLKLWAELEEKLINNVGGKNNKMLTIREAIRILYEKSVINEFQANQIDRLRRFRNDLVHTPKRITNSQVSDFMQTLEILLNDMKI